MRRTQWREQEEGGIPPEKVSPLGKCFVAKFLAGDEEKFAKKRLAIHLALLGYHFKWSSFGHGAQKSRLYDHFSCLGHF